MFVHTRTCRSKKAAYFCVFIVKFTKFVYIIIVSVCLYMQIVFYIFSLIFLFISYTFISSL